MTENTAPANAVIIAVGSELLTPYKVDTNSLFLTERLNNIGISVVQKLTVADDPNHLSAALQYAMKTAPLVIVTGGLGPTDDDVTRDVVASVFGRPLAVDSQLVEKIRMRFAVRNLVMPESNRRQAEVPHGAIVIKNLKGTAPGLWMEEGSVTVLLLPGPPRELKPMFERVVDERLETRTNGSRVYRRLVRTTGQTESYIDECVKPVYRAWLERDVPIATTVLSSLGQIDVHLSLVSSDYQVANDALNDAVRELQSRLGPLVVSTDGRSLPAVVGELLTDRGARVSVAESCTGGLITSRLTDVAGSSAYVHNGWTAYSDEAKTALLGIDPVLIESHGAVSKSVAEAMAMAARTKLGVDYGVGVTGIAGPDGGSPGKPVGTVYVALAGPDGALKVRQLMLLGDRERIKFQASQAALDLLRHALIGSALPR